MKDTVRREHAKSFFEAAEDTTANLAGRWLDEKEYEDIADYQKVLQKVADKHNVTITKMRKRPFGCLFVVNGVDKIVYQLSCTMKEYSYKRVK